MAACPRCGADNPDYAYYCGKCSQSLRDARGEMIATSPRASPRSDETSDVRGQAPQPPSDDQPPRSQTTKMCRSCGREVSPNYLFCPYCGSETPEGWKRGYRPDYYQGEYAEPVLGKKASGTLMLGGIMAILAGVLAIVQSIVLWNWLPLLSDSGLLCFCGGLGALFGLGSIAGGVFAIRRENFGLSLTGAIVGMLATGFGVGALFGLIAIICIAVSKEEYFD